MILDAFYKSKIWGVNICCKVLNLGGYSRLEMLLHAPAPNPPLKYSGIALLFTGESTHTASKHWHLAHHLCVLSSEKKIFRCQLYRYTAVRINSCLKELLQAKKPLWELRMRNWSHHVPTTLFMVSKNEWNTKEDPGKSIKNALYVQRHGKRHLSGWSDVK